MLGRRTTLRQPGQYHQNQHEPLARVGAGSVGVMAESDPEDERTVIKSNYPYLSLL